MDKKHSFDLHCHTTFSDGTFSPSELVAYAADINIHTIAITDHDTISGVPGAQEHACNLPVDVIPGIEISVDYKPGTLHICGYFINIHDEGLTKTIEFVQDSRTNRNPKIIEKFAEAGIPISMEEVKAAAGDEQIGRPHFAKVLVEKGFVKSTDEAFQKYLKKGARCYVDRPRLNEEEALSMITKAGGIAVVAHPSLLNLNGFDENNRYIQKLKSKGLRGIEVFSSHHTEEEMELFHSIAKTNNMLITGGSDFHGANHPDIHLGEFGNRQSERENIIETMYEHYKQHFNLV